MADYTLAVRSTRRPNEPFDCVTWWEHDFSYWPIDGSVGQYASDVTPYLAASDAGYFGGSNFNNNFASTQLVPDPTDPSPNGMVVECLYENGHPVGYDIGNWSLLSSDNGSILGPTPSIGTHTALQKLYLHYWARWGPDGATNWHEGYTYWRNWGTLNRALEHTGHVGSSILGARFTGNGRGSGYLGGYQYWYYQNTGGDRGLCPGYAPTPSSYLVAGGNLAYGTWHRFEHVIELSNMTTTPVVSFQTYINDSLVFNGVTGTEGDPLFNSMDIKPIVQIAFNNNPSGGTSPTQDWYLYYSDIYASGVEYVP